MIFTDIVGLSKAESPQSTLPDRFTCKCSEPASEGPLCRNDYTKDAHMAWMSRLLLFRQAVLAERGATTQHALVRPHPQVPCALRGLRSTWETVRGGLGTDYKKGKTRCWRCLDAPWVVLAAPLTREAGSPTLPQVGLHFSSGQGLRSGDSRHRRGRTALSHLILSHFIS